MISYLFPLFKVNFEVNLLSQKILIYRWYSSVQNNDQKKVTCRLKVLKDFNLESKIDGILHMYINFYLDFITCT